MPSNYYTGSRLFRLALSLMFLHSVTAVPYNLPKLSPSATWNPNATTFASNETTLLNPMNIFINTNNSVFVTSRNTNQTIVWSKGNATPTQILSENLTFPTGLFVTDNGNIYVDNGQYNYRIDMWMSNGTRIPAILNVPGHCFDIFIDDNNTLYCSMDYAQRVYKISLDDISKQVIIIAGNGSRGSNQYLLNYPNGILVDNKYNLYVADAWNNRIQFFVRGQLSGLTVSTVPYILSHPSDIIFDADGYLFIADYVNNRVIGSGATGYRCLVGCSKIAGTKSDQLNGPFGLSFDTDGNLFVVDQNNNRVQKFLLATNSLSTTKVSTSVLTSTSVRSSSISTTISSCGMLTQESSGLYTIMCLMITILHR